MIIFKALKISTLNSITFHTFPDLYEPCTDLIYGTIKISNSQNSARNAENPIHAKLELAQFTPGMKAQR